MTGDKIGSRLSSPRSIRGMLFLSLWPLLVLGWGIAAWISYQDAHHEIDELFDAQLVESAKLLREQVSVGSRDKHHGDDDDDDDDDDERHEKEREEQFHKYEQNVVFQIFAPDGTLKARSSSDVPAEPLSSVSHGYDDGRMKGRDFRIFVLRDERHGSKILVAQEHRIRSNLSARIALHMLLPGLFFLPVSGLIIVFGVNKGLRPLRRLAVEVEGRTAENLRRLETDAPGGRVPLEVKPLVESLNSLLTRLGTALENERRFTADAAHELRTPIAAVKTQLQVVRETENPEDRQTALEQARKGLDRIAHLISQLLDLARLDQMQGLSDVVPVDLRACAAVSIGDLANSATSRDIELSLDEGNAQIHGNPFLIEILVRNLVDNAIRYTPKGGFVRVRVGENGPLASLIVEDSGPGIPVEERAKAFERFFRGRNATSTGSGLGLSIVHRIAALHHGHVNLREGGSGQGLLVEVTFPGRNQKF